MDEDRDKNWRDMCEAAATEQDPDKLTALVAEIISALDDRNRKAAPPIQKKKDSPGTSFPSLPLSDGPKTNHAKTVYPFSFDDRSARTFAGS